MSDSVAIVTPAELVNFADHLKTSMNKVQSDGKKFKEVVREANAVWKDEKYRTFHREMDKCIEELTQCVKAGNKYAEFLTEKARLAQRYLDRR